MYADFELILEPIQGPNPDPNQPYSQNINQHISTGWCVYSKFAYGEVKDPLTLYRGKDCPEKFCDYIRQEAHRLYHMFPEKPMDPLTIFFKPFSSKEPKVRERSLPLHWSLQRARPLTM